MKMIKKAVTCYQCSTHPCAERCIWYVWNGL